MTRRQGTVTRDAQVHETSAKKGENTFSLLPLAASFCVVVGTSPAVDSLEAALNHS